MATSAYMIGRDDDMVSALERSFHALRDAGEARPPTLENVSAMPSSGREGVRGPVVAVGPMLQHGTGGSMRILDGHLRRRMQPYRWRLVRR